MFTGFCPKHDWIFPYATEFVIDMTGFLLSMTELVRTITGFVLNMNWFVLNMIWILEDAAHYEGLLLAPAEGFGLWPRFFFARCAKKKYAVLAHFW